MKKYFYLVLILLLGMIISSDRHQTRNIILASTPESESPSGAGSSKTVTTVITPSPSIETVEEEYRDLIAQTEEIFPDLYNCKMELSFTTGPLAGMKTSFTILGRDYFSNKGDEFFPGKNTAVYYEKPKYLILHSAFLDGNMLKPLEAEFIRYYLEYWGTSGNAFVQGNIDSLIGSSVIWSCNKETVFTSHIREVVRLSQTASNQLWLEPLNLEQILTDKEGLVTEWIGDMGITSEPTIYLGFCGWGPENSGDQRFVYYRYLINFDLVMNP